MSSYEIELSRSVRRALRDLPSDIRKRAVYAIDELAQIPRPRGVEKLRGADRLYRIRIGQYRLVYEIEDDQNKIRLARLGHRRDVYRGRR